MELDEESVKEIETIAAKGSVARDEQHAQAPISTRSMGYLVSVKYTPGERANIPEG